MLHCSIWTCFREKGTCAKYNHTFWEIWGSKGIRISSRTQPQHSRSKLFPPSNMTVLMLLICLQVCSLAALHGILKGDSPVATDPFIRMEKNCVNIFIGNHKSNINASEFSTISCMKPTFISALWLNLSTFGTQKKKKSARLYPFEKMVCLLSWGSHVLGEDVGLNLNCWSHYNDISTFKRRSIDALKSYLTLNHGVIFFF